MKTDLPVRAEYYRPTRARELRERAARLDGWLGGSSPATRIIHGTALGLVTLPPTLLVGIYGMNVPMPKFPGGDEVQFWWLTGLCVAMIVAMLFVFRRRRWI